MNAIIASAIIGFAATAHAAALATASGKARVVSNCQENVYIAAVACDATMTPINTVLNSGNPTFEQSFTEVTGNCGWSIKIGEDASLPSDNILQYEYTWQGPGQQVWYDMSLVNQNGDAVFPWAFASSDTSRCNPNNANYFTEPETTTGMQIQCPDDVDLTLYLCGTGSASVTSVASQSSTKAASSTSTQAASTTSSSSSSSSSSSTSTSAAPSTTTAAPSSSTPSTTASPTTLATSTRRGWGGWTLRQDNVAVSSTVSPSSSVSATTAADGVVVTETAVFYVTEVATAYVTARDAAPSPAAHKRHAHGHPHGVHA